jgi:hypothetical protein
MVVQMVVRPIAKLSDEAGRTNDPVMGRVFLRKPRWSPSAILGRPFI